MENPQSAMIPVAPFSPLPQASEAGPEIPCDTPIEVFVENSPVSVAAVPQAQAALQLEILEPPNQQEKQFELSVEISEQITPSDVPLPARDVRFSRKRKYDPAIFSPGSPFTSPGPSRMKKFARAAGAAQTRAIPIALACEALESDQTAVVSSLAEILEIPSVAPLKASEASAAPATSKRRRSRGLDATIPANITESTNNLTVPVARGRKRVVKVLDSCDSSDLSDFNGTRPNSKGNSLKFASIRIREFAVTADASKVPGSDGSCFSVGLHYEKPLGDRTLALDEWENWRAQTRNPEGVPEVEMDRRIKIWKATMRNMKRKKKSQETGEPLPADADDEEEPEILQLEISGDGDEMLVDPNADTESESESLSEEEQEAEELEKETSEVANSSCETPGSEEEKPAAPQTPKTPAGVDSPPISPTLMALVQPVIVFPSEKSYDLESDEPELQLLRASRRSVGCRCLGDRRVKSCGGIFEVGLAHPGRRPERVNRTRAQRLGFSSQEEAEVQRAIDLSLKGNEATEEPPSPEPPAVCECFLLGVGCNSNICSCSAICCSNPEPRHAFNQKKVDAFRKKILQQAKKEGFKNKKKTRKIIHIVETLPTLPVAAVPIPVVVKEELKDEKKDSSKRPRARRPPIAGRPSPPITAVLINTEEQSGVPSLPSPPLPPSSNSLIVSSS